MHRRRGGHSELLCGYSMLMSAILISVSVFQIITVICEDLHACPAGELTHASVTACVKWLSVVTYRYVTHLSLTLLHISHRQRLSISCWAGTSRIRWVRGARHNTSLGSTECWVSLSRVSNCHSCALCSGFYSAYSGRVPKFFKNVFNNHS